VLYGLKNEENGGSVLLTATEADRGRNNFINQRLLLILEKIDYS
jgi:hypothetical protein